MSELSPKTYREALKLMRSFKKGPMQVDKIIVNEEILPGEFRNRDQAWWDEFGEAMWKHYGGEDGSEKP